MFKTGNTRPGESPPIDISTCDRRSHPHKTHNKNEFPRMIELTPLSDILSGIWSQVLSSQFPAMGEWVRIPSLNLACNEQASLHGYLS